MIDQRYYVSVRLISGAGETEGKIRRKKKTRQMLQERTTDFSESQVHAQDQPVTGEGLR